MLSKAVKHRTKRYATPSIRLRVVVAAVAVAAVEAAMAARARMAAVEAANKRQQVISRVKLAKFT